ncbi:VOC family protein [Neobacillus kokaensis]|uniref:Extradiol dioxygenase n=1 Tax=Neobacillus kokaensis TaxID=2759023 RepID=A0ABQ3N5A7_9BACI|nr:VOC family protein [Neobacillus kokaensis]GHH98697.1 extradiol dioxygenase [Neobacillus kokaensis]
MGVQSNQIFVNLPVKDLQKSMEFYKQIGYEFNPQFTDEKAACMIIGENIFAMLLVQSFFKTFTKKELPDTHETTGVIIALSAESREQVNEIVDKAIAAGGKETSDPSDHGFMCYRSYQDLDGHYWEVMYMDPHAANG